MNVPMKWLKEYVDIKLDSKEYASRMVMTGTGVESIEQTEVGSTMWWWARWNPS